MMPTTSHIVRAIAELELEQANLEARLAKVKQAIALNRELFHLPGIRDSRKTRSAPANGHGHHGNGNGHGAVSDDAIRGALQAGPLTTRQLATALDADGGRLNYRLRALARDGVIRSMGRGRGKSVALAGKPAKEAP